MTTKALPEKKKWTERSISEFMAQKKRHGREIRWI